MKLATLLLNTHKGINILAILIIFVPFFYFTPHIYAIYALFYPKIC